MYWGITVNIVHANMKNDKCKYSESRSINGKIKLTITNGNKRIYYRNTGHKIRLLFKLKLQFYAGMYKI